MTENLFIYFYCLVISAVILIGILLQKNIGSRASKQFTYLVFASFSFLILNFACELPEGREKLSGLSFALNWLSFLAIDVILIAFCSYLASLLGDVKKFQTLGIKIAAGICLARAVLVTVFAFTGGLFSIENGYYREGSLAFIPYGVTCLALLLLVVTVVINRRIFSPKKLTVMLLYLTLPILAVLLELITNVYALTGASLTLSLLLVFVFVQTSTIEQGKMRETMLEEISSTDLLSGLYNRRAYYARIGSLDPEKPVGVLFFDLNGLKYTNDSFGHADGDELIKKFARLLTDSFPNENVFRISGDEFVAVLPDIAESELREISDRFREVIQANDSIAAFGGAFGECRNFEKLVSEAENAMYRDKKDFYGRQENGEIRSRDDRIHG